MQHWTNFRLFNAVSKSIQYGVSKSIQYGVSWHGKVKFRTAINEEIYRPRNFFEIIKSYRLNIFLNATKISNFFEIIVLLCVTLNVKARENGLRTSCGD